MTDRDRRAFDDVGTTTTPVWAGGRLLAGRSRLEAPVGQGAMGVVWRARDEERHGRVVAIKALPEAMRGDPRGMKQLRREADTAIELRHPRIVGVNHLEVGADGMFLVMEFVQGASLATRLAEHGPLNAEEVTRLAEGLCDALAYAHERGVIHRDIKPGNVLLAPDGPKLADFGIAVSVRETMHRLSGPRSPGTPPYMAPEQILGQDDPTPRTDLYQLAATLYECLAGQPPFYRGAIEYQIVNVAPRPLESVPEALAAAITRGLEKDPAARPANALEFKRLLRAAPDPDPSEMIAIPAGEFWMGLGDKDPSAFADEKPQHRVWLDGFAIDKDPVTNARWRRFIEAGGYRERTWWSPEGWQWREAKGIAEPSYWKDAGFNTPEQPVVGVSWHEAEAFCRWAGKRLPTEAEWEKAARGMDGRKYPWGTEWDKSRANSAEGGIKKTTPVGRYPQGASPYGVRDMAGNVWEWVADWYDGEYYKCSPARNPTGPESGSARVLRGGSWYDLPVGLRTMYRYGHTPDLRLSRLGFRCARGSS